MIRHHDTFLNNCLKQCLLDDNDIIDNINEILQTCLVFSRILVKFYSTAFIDEKRFSAYLYSNNLNIFEKKKMFIQEKNEMIEELYKEKKFLDTVETFKKSYMRRIEIFLDKINKL